MEPNDNRPPFNPELTERSSKFVESLRQRRNLPDPKLHQIMAEINQFPPEAKSYISFLTNTFLEEDIYKKVMSNPNSAERMLVRLLNTGLSMAQAHATLDYFKQKHIPETAPVNKDEK